MTSTIIDELSFAARCYASAQPMPTRDVRLSAVSVRQSVTFVHSVETNIIFSPSGSHTVLVFFHTKPYGNNF